MEIFWFIHPITVHVLQKKCEKEKNDICGQKRENDFVFQFFFCKGVMSGLGCIPF
jgi:hypothetical protein